MISALVNYSEITYLKNAV